MQVEAKNLAQENTRLREMFKRLTPQNSKNAHLVGQDGVHWTQPPFFHEVKLMEAYTYLVEKQVKGESMTEQDKSDVSLLLDWISRLRVDQILPVKDPGRRIIPPELLRNLAKDDLREQVTILNSPAFTQVYRWEHKMLGYLRSDIVRLTPGQSDMFALGDINALNDTIARNLAEAAVAGSTK